MRIWISKNLQVIKDVLIAINNRMCIRLNKVLRFLQGADYNKASNIFLYLHFILLQQKQS